MLEITKFKHKQHICLLYDSEARFLACDQNQQIFVEEYYDESYIAQHCLSLSGNIITTRDEQHGTQSITPFEIPYNSRKPQHPLEHPLNYLGLRLIGLREEDRVSSWVQPISIIEKMPLLQHLQLKISPMMLMGIAESHVLSQTQFTSEVDLLCRSVRLLIALPKPQRGDDGLLYDYETYPIYVLHPYNHKLEECPPLHQSLKVFPELTQPTDCLFVDGKLLVTNSGHGGKKSEVHIYQWDEQNAQSMLD